MTLRCLLGWHTLGGLVARGDRLHVRCLRCDRLSPGVELDAPRPRVTQPATPRRRTWWLRAVYERHGA